MKWAAWQYRMKLRSPRKGVIKKWKNAHSVTFVEKKASSVMLDLIFEKPFTI